MNLERHKILLITNLVSGVYLLCLVVMAGRVATPVWFGVVGELLTIPFLLALVVGTVISFLEFRKTGFQWRSLIFISFLFGLTVFIVLAIQTIVEIF